GAGQKLFSRNVAVGMLNTANQWLCFGALFSLIDFSQEISKLIGSCVAVTLSFFVNTECTFKSKATTDWYMAFVIKEQPNL
ncbi:GtrA family protein, partial [Citrobacter freundii]